MTAGPNAHAKAAAPAPAPEPEAPEAPTASAVPAAPQKSPHALRTITEVARDLDLPQHVLRFWETRFPGLRPLKRAGGRRYYRPEDMAMLRRIRGLLHDKGYTIKGAQKLLAKGGGGDSGEGGGAAAPAGTQAETQAGTQAGTPAPDPAAEHLRREAASLLQELKDIRTVLTVKP